MDHLTLFDARPPARRGRVRRSLDAGVTALRELGRLDPVDTPHLGLARVLADQLDAAIADPNESRYTIGTVAARYQSALDGLYDRVAPGELTDDGPSLADLLAALGDGP